MRILRLLLALVIFITTVPVAAAPNLNNSTQHTPVASEPQTTGVETPTTPVVTEAVETKVAVEIQEQPVVNPLSNIKVLMQQAGIPRSEWSAVDYIIFHESGWRPTAINSIGCVGLGQSCPGGSGLQTDCPDWRTNVICQLQHFNRYAIHRYGGWWGAYNWWINHHWW